MYAHNISFAPHSGAGSRTRSMAGLMRPAFAAIPRRLLSNTHYSSSSTGYAAAIGAYTGTELTTRL